MIGMHRRDQSPWEKFRAEVRGPALFVILLFLTLITLLVVQFTSS